jgi:hypothetical protein
MSVDATMTARRSATQVAWNTRLYSDFPERRIFVIKHNWRGILRRQVTDENCILNVKPSFDSEFRQLHLLARIEKFITNYHAKLTCQLHVCSFHHQEIDAYRRVRMAM